MGIRKQKVVYYSDRGQGFEIDEMQSSHLLNAINHHTMQIHVLQSILDGGNFSDDHLDNLLDRKEDLRSTVEALSQELASRTLEDDAKRWEGNSTRDYY